MLIWLNHWLHNCYTTRSSNGIFLDRLQDGYSLPFMGCTSKWLNVVPRLISKDLVDLVDLSNHHAAWINPPSLMLKSQCSDGYKMLQTHLSQLIGYCWIQYLCFFWFILRPSFPPMVSRRPVAQRQTCLDHSDSDLFRGAETWSEVGGFRAVEVPWISPTEMG